MKSIQVSLLAFILPLSIIASDQNQYQAHERTFSGFVVKPYDPKKFSVKLHAWPHSSDGFKGGAIAIIYPSREYDQQAVSFFTADQLLINIENCLRESHKSKKQCEPQKVIEKVLKAEASLSLAELECNRVALMLYFADRLYKAHGWWHRSDSSSAHFQTDVKLCENTQEGTLEIKGEHDGTPTVQWKVPAE